MRYVVSALLAVVLPSVAWADEVELTNGRTLVGIAREEWTRVVVETRLGDIGVPRDQVKSITHGRSVIHEYHERLDALQACPAAGEMFDLAVWAQEQRLVRYVHALLERTIELDPDHAEARKMLGYVRYDDRWIPAREREAVRDVEERMRKRETVAESTVPVRRSRPKPETVPYSLGIPPGPPRRGSTNYGGGYPGWFLGMPVPFSIR